MSSAIIVGATGQDGTFLYHLLGSKGYSILGLGSRRAFSNIDTWTGLSAIDIRDFQDVSQIIKKIQPDEIYHLAAVHHSSQDKVADPLTLLEQSYHVNVLSLQNFLDGIRQFSPKTKLFYAASSHIFGNPRTEPQDENTPMDPLNIYGITKVSGISLCRMYRYLYGTFASVGILYNHESWLRNEQFVSQKIIRGAIQCKKNPDHHLILGDLSVEVDWGFAPDYVDAMYKIVSLSRPDDFIIASGEKHSVREFVSIAFAAVGLDWQDYVEERKEIITKNPASLVGNPDKLIRQTGWKRSITFPDMVKIIISNTRG